MEQIVAGVELLKPFWSGDWTVSVINCCRILKLVHRESRAPPFKESISRRVHQSKPYWFVVSNIVAVQRVNNTNMRGTTSFNNHHCYQFILRIGMNFVMGKLRTSGALCAICFNILWLLNGITESIDSAIQIAIKWILMYEHSARESIAIYLFFSFLCVYSEMFEICIGLDLWHD